MRTRFDGRPPQRAAFTAESDRYANALTQKPQRSRADPIPAMSVA